MDDKLDSLRKSQWEVFDPEFAKMIKEEHPDIWDEGGNIKGNDQYEILSKIFEQGGTAKTDSQIAAIELREAWVARHEQDFRLPGVIAQIKWLAVGSRGEAYMKKLVRDEIEKRTSMENSDIDISMEDFLAHFGVKGMQWGVRKDRPSGIQSRSVDRDAAKDASEFARAKMYYGEGAGNRRKLIKAKVEAKSKANPNYKKAFDFHVARQDMSTHADKAMTERSRTDKKKAAKQTGGAVARRLTGEMGTKAAFVALAFTGAAFARSPQGQAVMKSGVSKAKDFVASQKGRSTVNYVSNFMKNQ